MITPTITPTPIPIDDLPPEFGSYVFGMFQHIIQGLKNVVIPFTHVNCYQVLVGTIILSAVFFGIGNLFGTKDKNRGGRYHE